MCIHLLFFCKLDLWIRYCVSFSCLGIFIIVDTPEITVQPQVKTRTEGDNLTLSCNATANPVPTISWTRDGSPVDINDNERMGFSAKKTQLSITNVSRTDSGEYRCVARNSLGNDTSNPAKVDIQCNFLNDNTLGMKL